MTLITPTLFFIFQKIFLFVLRHFLFFTISAPSFGWSKLNIGKQVNGYLNLKYVIIRHVRERDRDRERKREKRKGERGEMRERSKEGQRYLRLEEE